MPKATNISIVIPAYNEADTIQACLDAIAAQTVMPHEVIVVDNNSTDNTAQLARRYSFVRVISEPKQGVVHARNTGFNAATGDIIGRIDADSRIAPDWVEALVATTAGRSVDAVSGGVTYYGISFPQIWNMIDVVARRYFALTMRREYTLQGANMALTQHAWQTVKNSMCARTGLHEDLDLAIHLHAAGFRAAYAPELQAEVCLRQAGNTFREYTKYVLVQAESYRRHGRIRSLWLYLPAVIGIVSYPFINLAYRGYDPARGKFSWRSFLTSTAVARVSPVSFID